MFPGLTNTRKFWFTRLICLMFISQYSIGKQGLYCLSSFACREPEVRGASRWGTVSTLDNPRDTAWQELGDIKSPATPVEETLMAEMVEEVGVVEVGVDVEMEMLRDVEEIKVDVKY